MRLKSHLNRRRASTQAAKARPIWPTGEGMQAQIRPTITPRAVCSGECWLRIIGTTSRNRMARTSLLQKPAGLRNGSRFRSFSATRCPRIPRHF